MDQNPDPENLGYGIAGGLALLAAMGAYFKRITNRSNPRDAENEAFRRECQAQMDRMEGIVNDAMAKVDRALGHSDQIHEGMRISIGELTTGLALVKSNSEKGLALVNKDIEYIRKNGNGRP